MRQPVLTIAIPTYNRANCLYNLLQKLATQLAGLPNGTIEVLVINNQSTDSTADVGRTFANVIPRFRWIDNNENIGVERNIMKCAECALGEFVHVFGDDDEPLDPLWKALIGSMEANPQADLFVLNFSQRWKDMQHVLCESVLPFTEDTAFPRYRDFFGAPDSWAGIGFISAVVFRRHLFMQTDCAYYAGLGSFYGQTGSLLEAFSDRPACLIAKPLVIQRQCNQRHDATRPEEATMIPSFAAYLGTIRLMKTLAAKGVFALSDFERISARYGFGPIGTTPIGSLPEWFAHFYFKSALMQYPDQFTKEIFDETRAFASSIENPLMRQRLVMLNDLGYSVATHRQLLQAL